MKISIPPSIQISSISAPCVCHFKDKQHHPDGPPHFYVIIPVNTATDLVLTMITSQIESRTAYYSNRPDAFASLIAVEKCELPFLSVNPSLIDCNNVEVVPKADLSNKYDPVYGFEMKMSSVPEALQKKIVAAIQNSPIVKPVVKKLLKNL